MRFRERDSERKKRRMAGRNLEEMSNHNFCVEQVPSHIATVGGHLKITVRFPHKHSFAKKGILAKDCEARHVTIPQSGDNRDFAPPYPL